MARPRMVGSGAATLAPGFRTKTIATGSSTAPSAALPSGSAVGDVLVALVACRGGTNLVTITAATGWTLVRRDNDGTTIAAAIYTRVVGVSEPTPTWGLSPTEAWKVTILRYSGINNTTVPDGSAHGGTAMAGSSSSSMVAPSVSPTGTTDILIGFFTNAVNPETFTVPGGMADREQSSSATGPLGSDACDQSLVASGATGTRTATLGTAATRGVSQLVALLSV